MRVNALNKSGTSLACSGWAPNQRQMASRDMARPSLRRRPPPTACRTPAAPPPLQPHAPRRTAMPAARKSHLSTLSTARVLIRPFQAARCATDTRHVRHAISATLHPDAGSIRGWLAELAAERRHRAEVLVVVDRQADLGGDGAGE